MTKATKQSLSAVLSFSSDSVQKFADFAPHFHQCASLCRRDRLRITHPAGTIWQMATGLRPATRGRLRALSCTTAGRQTNTCACSVKTRPFKILFIAFRRFAASRAPCAAKHRSRTGLARITPGCPAASGGPSERRPADGLGRRKECSSRQPRSRSARSRWH